MNVFPDQAICELSHFLLQPLFVVYIKETRQKQPKKPVTIIVPMNGNLRNDDKLLVFQGGNDEFKDITETTKLEVEKEFVSVHLSHFGWTML